MIPPYVRPNPCILCQRDVHPSPHVFVHVFNTNPAYMMKSDGDCQIIVKINISYKHRSA